MAPYLALRMIWLQSKKAQGGQRPCVSSPVQGRKSVGLRSLVTLLGSVDCFAFPLTGLAPAGKGSKSSQALLPEPCLK